MTRKKIGHPQTDRVAIGAPDSRFQALSCSRVCRVPLRCIAPGSHDRRLYVGCCLVGRLKPVSSWGQGSYSFVTVSLSNCL